MLMDVAESQNDGPETLKYFDQLQTFVEELGIEGFNITLKFNKVIMTLRF